MYNAGLKKLFWGFLFVMFTFRIQGFDVLPDVVGYIFFALGLSVLASESQYFTKASQYNIPMIIISIFSIYTTPAKNSSVNFGTFGLLSIIIGIAAFILNLILIYNIFMGIKEMADKRNQYELATEAAHRWNQYKILQIASLLIYLMIFIPFLAFFYIIGILVASIILGVIIMGFINRCSVAMVDSNSSSL